MATRMQQRRGTAAQWTSANPVLNAGEIGWESDTNKFKIGDGTNHWANIDYFADINSTVNPSFGSSIVFEGATANDFETTLQVTDPTADRTITIPDATTTLVGTDTTQTLTNKTLTTPVISSITNGAATLTLPTSTGTVALTTDIPAGVVTESGTQTLTNKTLTSPVINTPTGITKTDIGLANVDNTSDANKPVSTAGQSALDLKANLSGATFTGAISGTSLTLSGDLTVNGTTTNINSTNLVIEDKNIILGDAAEPTDTTANGGGITLKGATDKTFNWLDATDSWTSSEHLTLNATKEFRLADTDSTHYVGFKAPGTVSTNKVWVLPAADGTAGQALSTDGSGNLSWATSGGGAAFSELMLAGC
jgi:hypothetical protein